MLKESIGRNYLHIEKDLALMVKDFCLFPCTYYAYVDTGDHLADKIFTDMELKVKFVSEYEGKDDPFYRVILIRIPNTTKAINTFIRSMSTLYRNQLLANVDYDDMCLTFHKSSGTLKEIGESEENEEEE